MAPKNPAATSAGGKPTDKGARAGKQRRSDFKQRSAQIFQAFRMQRREDKWLLPWMVGSVVLVAGVLFGLGFIWGLPWFFLAVGIALGLLAAVNVFGRRVQRNVYTKAEGQPGAAAWALDNLRGKRWRVTHAVAGTTQMDAVHRVLGMPGVVLVAEGAPHRVKPLLAQEKKRVSRLVGDTPIYDIVIGNEEGHVPLRKLQRHMGKLPHNIMPSTIENLEKRLSALGSHGAAMPKGPAPDNAKMAKMQQKAQRNAKRR